jgi:hypothetical protein
MRHLLSMGTGGAEVEPNESAVAAGDRFFFHWLCNGASMYLGRA